MYIFQIFKSIRVEVKKDAENVVRMEEFSERVMIGRARQPDSLRSREIKILISWRKVRSTLETSKSNKSSNIVNALFSQNTTRDMLISNMLSSKTIFKKIQEIRAQSKTDFRFLWAIFSLAFIAHARDIDTSANKSLITQRPARYLLVLFPPISQSGIPLFPDRTQLLYLAGLPAPSRDVGRQVSWRLLRSMLTGLAQAHCLSKPEHSRGSAGCLYNWTLARLADRTTVSGCKLHFKALILSFFWTFSRSDCWTGRTFSPCQSIVVGNYYRFGSYKEQVLTQRWKEVVGLNNLLLAIMSSCALMNLVCFTSIASLCCSFNTAISVRSPSIIAWSFDRPRDEVRIDVPWTADEGSEVS